MTMRKILEIATQIIGVYLILTAIPAFISSLITSFIAMLDVGFAEIARVFLTSILATVVQFLVGLWAVFSAESLSRKFRPNDD